jgi:hypothetical protein
MKARQLLLIVPLAMACRGSAGPGRADHPATLYTEAVQTDARRMMQALYSGDFDTLLDYTYPELTQMMGGSCPVKWWSWGGAGG